MRRLNFMEDEPWDEVQDDRRVRWFGHPLDTDMLGATMAHEVGHQMGLRHTSESKGDAHDFLADTPECTTVQDQNGDGTITADECINQDGAYMMFWGSD